MFGVAHRTPRTRAGCERLAAAGARLFEADVQVDVQVDGGDRVIVSHYLPVGRAGRLQRDNWRLRWHRPARRDRPLCEVAALVPAGCLVLLDVKERQPERRARLRAALAVLPERDRYRVCAPHGGDLAELRAAGFRTWRTVGDARELAALLAAGASGDEAVTVRHTLLTAEAVERLHRLGVQVVAWTVNGRRRADRLQRLGVDGITTDRPAILRAIGTARG